MPSVSTVVTTLGVVLLILYVVFRYLDVQHIQRLDIASAVAETRNVRCSMTWNSPDGQGSGVIHFGTGVARLDYVLTSGSRTTQLAALLNARSGDAFMWSPSDTVVVHLSNAIRRPELQNPWWKEAKLSECTPVWMPKDDLYVLPVGAKVVDR